MSFLSRSINLRSPLSGYWFLQVTVGGTVGREKVGVYEQDSVMILESSWVESREEGLRLWSEKVGWGGIGLNLASM